MIVKHCLKIMLQIMILITKWEIKLQKRILLINYKIKIIWVY